MTTETEKWYGLTASGDIIYLGEYDSFEAANDDMPDDIIYLLSTDIAHEWRATLDRHLGDDGYPTDLKYEPYPPKGESK